MVPKQTRVPVFTYKIVIPVCLPAGRQSFSGNPELWIPAFAGMTAVQQTPGVGFVLNPEPYTLGLIISYFYAIL